MPVATAAGRSTSAAPVSVIAYWTKGYVNDTDRFASSLAPLAEDPAVQAYLVDQIVTVVLETPKVPNGDSPVARALEALERALESDPDLLPKRSAQRKGT